jgi:alcohol dehydrogenase class IV
MIDFAYDILPGRVLFGAGSRDQVSAEINRLRCSRALVLSTAGYSGKAKELAHKIGQLAAGTFSGAAMHTPVSVSEEAVKAAQAVNADCLVSVGGGSTIGLGKAVALRTDLPQIVLPTTYAGSEMTPILGETVDGKKSTQRTQKVLPEVVIYDPELTLTLPADVSVTSGINAVAHAVEALYAKDRIPLVSLMAAESIRMFVRSLPHILAEPLDLSVRSDALYGAWLAGICLGAVGMSLHHKLCHVLGGTFNLPHAETHTVVLPHAIAYNEPAEPEVMRSLAELIGGNSPSTSLYELVGRLGAKRSLRDLGMPETGIEKAVLEATQNPYWNPRELEPESIRGLIRRAWAGEPPGE